MCIEFSDVSQGGTQTQYKTSEWYAIKKSLEIADLNGNAWQSLLKGCPTRGTQSLLVRPAKEFLIRF